jgi:hypothetical protein
VRTSFPLLVSLFILSGTVAAAPESPEEFFNRFVELGHRFDASVVDLYLDSASIKMYRRYPHGLERAMEVSGSEWKVMLRKIMPLARPKNDKSTYANVKFQSLGTKVKITAQRYAVRKCYTDPAYYLVIERQPGGAYGVVEEYFETEPRPDC